MKQSKRLAAGVLSGMLMVTLAACGGGTTKDATADIQAATEKMNALESMDATMVMEMDMSVMGQKVETDTLMTMSCFNDPLKLKADMTMDMGSYGSTSMSLYAAMDGNDYTMYLYDGNSWTSDTVDMGYLQQYDAQESMNLYLESGSQYTMVGTEEINGSAANKYTGVVTGDALEEVMAASGAASNLETSLGSDLDLSDLYSDLGDLQITVWVDQQSGYPVRYYMDMTKMMQSVMEKAIEAAASGVDMSGMMTVDRVVLTMDCSNFDNVADFSIPEEALAS